MLVYLRLWRCRGLCSDIYIQLSFENMSAAVLFSRFCFVCCRLVCLCVFVHVCSLRLAIAITSAFVLKRVSDATSLRLV